MSRLRSHGRRWVWAVGLWLCLVAALPTALVLWSGMAARNLTYEDALVAVRGERNREAAIEQLRHLIVQGVRAIRRHELNDGRSGEFAREALTQIHKETAPR